MIEINIPSRWGYNMAEIVTRPIFGPSGNPIGQKFLLAQTFAFFRHLVTCPPFIFAKNDEIQKKFFFYLRYVNGYYNQALVLWCCSSQLLKIYK